MDKFDEWNEIKRKIDEKEGFKIKVAAIYWVSVGQNVGTEIYGKGGDFLRPVLVVKKIFDRAFIGIPLTGKDKGENNFLYYKFKDSKDRKQTALLTQIRLFDTKRVKSFKSKIPKSMLQDIKERVKNVFE
ncbi:type II toxin-antitoxin system PemK/MazF family toxin [Campylobacter rectus]|uniref:type II toxin-antitoxin system PemK/MazF family toxin n=1 Tax=Campylobacter rectus TaxID=203 RepID=UPI0028E2A54E|nr:type II toxin-antitoxin system PemK/MazF family toxin [Campylobacter rectus]